MKTKTEVKEWQVISNCGQPIGISVQAESYRKARSVASKLVSDTNKNSEYNWRPRRRLHQSNTSQVEVGSKTKSTKALVSLAQKLLSKVSPEGILKLDTFFEEVVIFNSLESILLKDFYSTYAHWVKSNGARLLGIDTIQKILGNLGHKFTRTKDGFIITGIGVRATANTESEECSSITKSDLVRRLFTVESSLRLKPKIVDRYFRDVPSFADFDKLLNFAEENDGKSWYPSRKGYESGEKPFRYRFGILVSRWSRWSKEERVSGKWKPYVP